MLQGYERGDGTLVAYSLGNFVFDGFSFSRAAPDSAILDVTLTMDGVTDVRWIPVVVERGLPRLAEGADAERVLGRLARVAPGD